MKGRIKNVNTDKGFGFIRGENGTEYFFHRSAMQGTKFEDLQRGSEVEFTEAESDRGPRAEEVSFA